MKPYFIAQSKGTFVCEPKLHLYHTALTYSPLSLSCSLAFTWASLWSSKVEQNYFSGKLVLFCAQLMSTKGLNIHLKFIFA
jgi:hypothetical protein